MLGSGVSPDPNIYYRNLMQTATPGGVFLFGFAAVFRAGNEPGIDESVSVGCKGGFGNCSYYANSRMA